MRELAEHYLSYFVFEPDCHPALSVRSDAPEDLKRLIEIACSPLGDGASACAFEALNAFVDADDPFFPDVDEKVCPLDMYAVVVDILSQQADAASQAR